MDLWWHISRYESTAKKASPKTIYTPSGRERGGFHRSFIMAQHVYAAESTTMTLGSVKRELIKAFHAAKQRLMSEEDRWQPACLKGNIARGTVRSKVST